MPDIRRRKIRTGKNIRRESEGLGVWADRASQDRLQKPVDLAKIGVTSKRLKTYVSDQCNSYIGHAVGRNFVKLVMLLMKNGYIITKLLTATCRGDTFEKSYISVRGYCTGDKIYEFEAMFSLNPNTYHAPDNDWILSSLELE